MQLVQVENGEIIQYNLPKVGVLKDGSTVSCYDILMKSDLELAKQEGWIPLEDNQPTYNEETQYLVDDGYEILVDKVVKKYIVENVPIVEDIQPQPSEIDLLNEKIDTQNIILEEILFDILPMIGGIGGE